jgi:hypothetical protein
MDSLFLVFGVTVGLFLFAVACLGTAAMLKHFRKKRERDQHARNTRKTYFDDDDTWYNSGNGQ